MDEYFVDRSCDIWKIFLNLLTEIDYTAAKKRKGTKRDTKATNQDNYERLFVNLCIALTLMFAVAYHWSMQYVSPNNATGNLNE